MSKVYKVIFAYQTIITTRYYLLAKLVEWLYKQKERWIYSFFYNGNYTIPTVQNCCGQKAEDL